MSWKRAEGTARNRWWRESIAGRLTLYYILASFALLAAASVRFYFGLSRSMDRTHWTYLEDKVQVIPSLLRHGPADGVGVNPALLDEAEVSGGFPSRFFLRVLDERGEELVSTPGMDESLPRDVFPAAREGGLSSGRRCIEDRCFLLASEAVIGRAPAWPHWQIQAALDVSSEDALLGSYLRQTVGVLVVGVLLAALIGAWIARRGLTPLADITRATERIGAQRLHERIGLEHWPRELTALAGAFDRMLERLQDSFERLSQFSADLAHELRTPITNLMGAVQVALSRPRTPPEYVEVLQSALEEYERLARMIESMLFLAFADHALPDALRRAPLDAHAQMQAVVDFFEALADERQIALHCAGHAPLLADASLVRRALNNLVSNAIEYTAPGGRVWLTAAALPQGPTLSVADTGIGIADEHLPKLSNRFYRVDPSRSSAHSGSGLGLAIVRSIMELHGGSLSIESRVGQGTVVTLHFPPVTSATPAAEPHPPAQ